MEASAEEIQIFPVGAGSFQSTPNGGGILHQLHFGLLV
jgi:hypothetical protein